MVSEVHAPLSALLIPVDLPCYPELEAVLAYGGDMRYAMFIESSRGQSEAWHKTFIWSDGHWRNPANAWAFYLWAAHPKTIVVIGEVALNGDVGLLLDRQERKLYLFTASGEHSLDVWLEENNTPLSNPSAISWGVFVEAQTKAGEFLRWLGK